MMAAMEVLVRMARGGDLTGAIERMEVHTQFSQTDRAKVFLMQKAQDPAMLHAYLQENPAAVHHRDPDDWTPLMLAVLLGWADGVRVFLRNGADPTAGSPGHTPLMLAIKRGHTEVALEIARHMKPAEMDQTKKDSKPASIYAILHGNADVLGAILDGGGSKVLRFRSWPLVLHAARYSAACLRVLLDRGVPPSVAYDGISPLHAAASHGNAIVCALLVDRGANLCLKTTYGTPEGAARSKHFNDCADWLKAERERREETGDAVKSA